MLNEYTDAELEALPADLESYLVERKETFKGSAPTTVREAVCAFANDLPNHRRPGVVIIGARDDGTASGMAVTDELLRQLADIKTDGQIGPPPTRRCACLVSFRSSAGASRRQRQRSRRTGTRPRSSASIRRTSSQP